jgi:hypothetical protein
MNELLVLGEQPSVSNNNITKISMDELNQIQDLTDWEKVKEMTDKEIEANANQDNDCQSTDDDFWDNAKVVKPKIHRVSQLFLLPSYLTDVTHF